jgi:protein-tyrosine-phosphatase
MAEALLRRRLDERGVAVRLGSAGFLQAGWPATDAALAVMADIGLDLTGHRSRVVTADMLEHADLVVAMTRQHAIDLALLAPDAARRVFQFRDLVRRAERRSRRLVEEPLRQWVLTLDAGTRPATLLALDLHDDIADPVGLPRAAYERTRQTLDHLCTRLADAIA